MHKGSIALGMLARFGETHVLMQFLKIQLNMLFGTGGMDTGGIQMTAQPRKFQPTAQEANIFLRSPKPKTASALVGS